MRLGNLPGRAWPGINHATRAHYARRSTRFREDNVRRPTNWGSRAKPARRLINRAAPFRQRRRINGGREAAGDLGGRQTGRPIAFSRRPGREKRHVRGLSMAPSFAAKHDPANRRACAIRRGPAFLYSTRLNAPDTRWPSGRAATARTQRRETVHDSRVSNASFRGCRLFSARVTLYGARVLFPARVY